jgi:hypothetical protein
MEKLLAGKGIAEDPMSLRYTPKYVDITQFVYDFGIKVKLALIAALNYRLPPVNGQFKTIPT